MISTFRENLKKFIRELCSLTNYMKILRSKETMSLETRKYHKSDFGVISGDVKDNSDVGISMEFTADPLMDGLTGLKKKNVKNMTVANTTSNVSLLYVDNDKDD